MNGASFCWASFVMSTSTGPGRPVVAIWYAAAMRRRDVLGVA